MSEAVTLEVTTFLFGLGAERRSPPVRLSFARRTTSARALIAEHVQAEVARARSNRESSLALHYLLADNLRASAVAVSAEQLDIAAETERACTGLAERRYMLVVDGMAISNLEEQITLSERSRVSFVRLLPLVGG